MARQMKFETIVNKLSDYLTCIGSDNISSIVSGIDSRLTLKPNIPIGVFIQESYNHYGLASEDFDLLVSRGIGSHIIKELPIRIDYLRDVEAQWWKVRYGRTTIEKEFLVIHEKVQNAVTGILRDLQFAGYRDRQVSRIVNAIRKGSGELDFTEDLYATRAMAIKHADLLRSVGSDPQLAENLDQCSNVYPLLYADYVLQRSKNETMQDHRNQAYTYLFITIEEIRRFARHALAHDPRRLKGYASEYFRKSSRLKTGSPAVERAE